ncbi:ABC transporter permease [Mucilaginibacter mali]|uniref:ABC transporter permease n=1 Tax=Mucilaginibacter mali TaxID=2740462 RepID=A0A7D4Q357_9SPHI|nr:FtsX-like permease family protein [Mucilaginibacter mali]QKJ30087.1 ABC transporter permease [Mucilaginibacter mali]
MIKNYFKTAFRSFWRHKLFTFINIIGLSIGISASIVIYLIAHFDLTFDKFHKDGDRIYRIVTNFSFQGEPGYNSGVPTPAGDAVIKEVPGIVMSAPFFTMYDTKVVVNNEFNAPKTIKNDGQMICADERYFAMFNYTWLKGSAKTSLNQPNQVVLTTNQAKGYFPKLSYDQVIGRQVIYDDSIKTTVTGIVEPFKEHSDFVFHDFISYNTGLTNSILKDNFRMQWNNVNSQSQLFVKLGEAAEPAAVNKALTTMLHKHDKPRPGNSEDLMLEKLSDLHFDNKYYNFDNVRSADKTTLYGLLGIAVFLLLLGCINFINLTTAQASQRAKEIGIRKTLGSNRRQLIFQFLSETFLITLFAVIISVGLTPVILKLFAGFIPPGVEFSLLQQPNLIVFLLLLTLVVSLLSGFYPSLILSGYKPVSVLKNQAQSNSNKTRNAVLRKSLTVTQFVIAQFFIMATILVSKQIHYMLNKDLGFKKDAIVYLSTPTKLMLTNKQPVFMDLVRQLPQIEMISVGGNPPSSGGAQSTVAVYNDGKKEIKMDLEQKYGDANYLKVYHLKLLAGHNLADQDSSTGLIINNTYAKLLGFRNPNDAVGKRILHFEKQKEIVGVVADFHQKSLRSVIKPLAILHPGERKFWNRTFHIALKPQTAGGNEWKTAIAGLEKAWKSVYPEDDFEYHFFDESIARFYESEQQTSTLLSWATGLSILISCLGMLGLAIYTTGQRTKEIGVRKVLGASVTQIVALLSAELLWLILLAFVLVSPVAYYAMHKWMQNFADHTSISWWIFILGGGVMVVATLFTLSFQTVKAAVANPVKSLRSE